MLVLRVERTLFTYSLIVTHSILIFAFISFKITVREHSLYNKKKYVLNLFIFAFSVSHPLSRLVIGVTLFWLKPQVFETSFLQFFYLFNVGLNSNSKGGRGGDSATLLFWPFDSEKVLKFTL